jgi:hypothetical protein
MKLAMEWRAGANEEELRGHVQVGQVVTWPGKPTAGTGGTCRDGPEEEEEPLHACLCQKAFPFLGCKAIIKKRSIQIHEH